MSDSLIMLQRIGKINKGTELHLPDDIFNGSFRQKLHRREQSASRIPAARPALRKEVHFMDFVIACILLEITVYISLLICCRLHLFIDSLRFPVTSIFLTLSVETIRSEKKRFRRRVGVRLCNAAAHGSGNAFTSLPGRHCGRRHLRDRRSRGKNHAGPFDGSAQDVCTGI